MGKKKKQNELEQHIVQVLDSYPDTYVPIDLIAGVLGMHAAREMKRLNKMIHKMIQQKILRQNGSGQVMLKVNAQESGMFEGILDINRHGVGFVNVSGFDQDIRIPHRRMGTALPGDLVRVKLTGKSRLGDRTEGKVLEIKKRANRIFVGTIEKSRGGVILKSDEKSAHVDFFVHPSEVKNGKHGDKVIFRLRTWVNQGALPEAEVIDILGPASTNNAAILSILAENQMVSTFPREVDQFANQIAVEIPQTELSRRKDLRNDLIITIDPVDAKDFDDALSIAVTPRGTYQLGVHIADVTHYVNSDTVLDKEALERGTSVYLVDRVIPMLPETLSNGVCSLRPDEDKLTYSCFMEIDSTGTVLDYSIEETVIRSKYRLTYEQAQEIIEGKASELSGPLGKLFELSKILMKKRFDQGSVNLDTVEPRFILDETGKPLEIIIKNRVDSHRLVEECMLIANKTVAIHIDHLRNKKAKGKFPRELYPFLYRVHDKPDPEKMLNIAEILGPLGIKFNPGTGKISPKMINKLLGEIKNTPIENHINSLVVRSMAKAVYSPGNIGHFGLGFKHYAHFTSPIRRYPDVIVHRLLKNYAAGVPGYIYEQLEELGRHTSEREKMAANAERDSVKLKQVEYLSERIGSVYEGVISGVIEKGIFVTLNDIYCDGLVHISDLTDDYYVYDEKRHLLVGRSKKRTFRLGDSVTVKVIETSIEQRTIDFALVSTKS